MVKSLFCWMLWSVFLTNLMEGGESKICLTLIIKNDAKVIDRCLNSARDIADCLCVCDNGSTDATKAIIEKFMLEAEIPGMIYQQEVKGLGYSKALAVQTAQKMLKEFSYPSTSTFLLVLDPEMVLNVAPSFKKNALTADFHLVSEKSPLGFSTYSRHFLRASLSWESSGRIFEEWSATGARQGIKIHDLAIEDQKSHDRVEKKLTEDLQFLAEAYSQDPENSKIIFYLAQSYRCLQRHEEAIELYKTRIEKKEERDEVWFSKYMIGECYEEMEVWPQALYWYLEAYQQNSTRAESLRKIATHYRLKGQNDLAYIFAKYGSSVPSPHDPVVLTDPSLNYQFDEELSIAAYYTRFKQEGFEAANNILLKKNVPWWIKYQTYRNILFYVQNLPNVRFRTIEVELPFIREGYDERYHPMNPSIQKTGNGYNVICRSVNYTQMGAKTFNTIEEDGIFRTRNFLIEYGKNLKVIAQHEIIENLPRERIPFTKIEGLDDCRIFEFNGSSWFICTTNDTNPKKNFQISLCKLEDIPKSNQIEVEKLVPLLGPDPHRCEKNWLPFVKNGQFHAIYSYDPFLIYKPDVETGECETVLQYDPAYDFSHFRGSAGPIEFDDGYLIVVHEVVHYHDNSRAYLHRFLYLDKNYNIVKASKPFTFRHKGIEYCCSMVIDHSGQEIIMALGIEDREAYLCSIDLQDVKQTLEPLPIFNEQIFVK